MIPFAAASATTPTDIDLVNLCAAIYQDGSAWDYLDQGRDDGVYWALKRLDGDATRAAAAEASANGLRDQVALLTKTVEMLRAMVPGTGTSGSPDPAATPEAGAAGRQATAKARTDHGKS